MAIYKRIFHVLITHLASVIWVAVVLIPHNIDCKTSSKKSTLSRKTTTPSFPIDIDDIPELQKNASIKKVERYYRTLYGRLHGKEYGLAGFEDPCLVTTTVDLEDHLDSARKILKMQDPDGKYHKNKRIEDHLRPKLRAFFHRSKNYCDFKKLLTCDKSTKRCSCAHSSMQFGTEGTDQGDEGCEIKIGKRCAFTDSQLIQFGIPIIPSQPVTLKCVGQASECVSSFGAASKICKCKTGYIGPGCKPTARRYKYSSNEVIPVGRSFTGDGGKGVGELGKNGTIMEYFLYPEEVQAELVKVLNVREMFQPEEREKEAEILYSKMESDNEQEGMVIRHIYIRRAAILKYGDHCDPEKQELLDNPPLLKEGSVWVDPKPESIKTWQLSLLKDGKPFCNIESQLMCDDIMKVCQCREGLFYEAGHCKVVPGQACGSDYEGIFQFDLLQDRKRFTPPLSPPCTTGSSCGFKPLFFTKQCWCDEGATCGGAVAPVQHLDTDIQGRFTLNLDDECDPKSHRILLNPKEKEIKDYQERIIALEKLLGKTPPVQFCNLQDLLNCSSTTSKCECFDYLAREGDGCRVRNRDSCQETYSTGASFGNQKMWKIEQVFEKSFQPTCIKTAECTEEDKKCKCVNDKGGDLCSDPRSIFSSVLNPIHVMGYDEEREVNQAFYALNYYAYRMEKIMSVAYNTKCDTNVGVMAERIVQFYRDIGSSDINLAGSKTLYQYKKTSKWIKYLLKTGVKRICNGFKGLYCHPLTEKCQCQEGQVYENGTCRLNGNQECDPDPKAFWIPTCRNNSECLPALFNFRYTCQCHEGLSGEDCSESIPEEDHSPQLPDCDDPAEASAEECEALKNSTTAPTNLTAFFDEFDEMKRILEDIMANRSISEGLLCFESMDHFFTSLFPSLPTFERDDYERLPQGKRHSLLTVRVIHKNTYRFCDRRVYLRCEGGTCFCDPECQAQRQHDVCSGKAPNQINPLLLHVMNNICLLYKWGKEREAARGKLIVAD